MTNATEAANRELVLAFFDKWNAGDVEGILADFSMDAVYRNMPTPAMHGAGEIREFLEGFFAAFTISIETTAIAVDGDMVLTERDDILRGDAGRCDLPIMGVMRIVDGKIAEWRDYFDSRQAEGFTVEDAAAAVN